MRTLTNLTLTIGGAALIAGCGGSSQSIGLPGPLLQDRKIITRVAHGESWMLPQPTGQDLLYVDAGEDVDVYTYPQDQFVGNLGNFGGVDGMCTDKIGDVFIPEYYGSEVLEYPHGATSPSATINTPGSPIDCSVDRATGDLAVTQYNEVNVYSETTSGWGFPSTYTDSSLGLMNFCTYDASGDLFVDGFDGGYQLAELPAGGSTFTNITLSRRVKAKAYGVMWDGHNIAIASGWRSPRFPTPIYRFSVSGSAGTLVGITKLRGSGGQFHAFWLQGKKLIGSHIYGEGIWNYPRGGQATKQINGVGGAGVTVSVGSTR